MRRFAETDNRLTESLKPLKMHRYSLLQRPPLSVYRPLVGALWRTLEHYGVEPSLAIDPELYDPAEEPEHDRVRFESYNRALARAAELVGDAALGLRLAEQMHPSHVGALGYAWLASSSLATAIQRLYRFGRMTNDHLKMQIDEDDNSLTVGMRLDAASLCPEVIADLHIGTVFRFARMNYGQRLRPLRVTFTRPVPEGRSRWDDFFEAEVRFAQPGDAISFSKADVRRKLTVSDRAMVRVHESVIERYLAQLDRTRVVGRARAIIVDMLPSGAPTADQVAARLNMNARTLHRKLASEDAAFRSLLADVRKSLAARHIADPTYDITEIAFMLGYSDTSAFSRAFRSWFGKSPSEARTSGRR